MRSTLIRVFALTLFAVALLALAQPAVACTFQCQKVGPFCRACVDTGTFTDAACQQVGPCGCQYVQVVCFHSASDQGAAAKAEPAFLAPEAALQTPADGAAVPAVEEPREVFAVTAD